MHRCQRTGRCHSSLPGIRLRVIEVMKHLENIGGKRDCGVGSGGLFEAK